MIEQISRILPMIGVASLMVSMGLGLTIEHFVVALTRPKAVIIGLFGQVLVLPLAAFALAFAFALPAHIAFGMVIIAACPGGALSNAFSVLIDGDLALSIVLTALSSLLAFVTVPIVINAGAEVFAYRGGAVELGFADTALQLFLTTALPIVLGMCLRRYGPAGIMRLGKPLFWTGFFCLIAPSVSFVSEYYTVVTIADAIPSTTAVLLNFLMVGCGFGLARISGLSAQQARTLAVEVGIQNYGLMLVIIVVFFEDPRLLMPAIFYLPAMLTSAYLIWFLKTLSSPEVAQ